VSDASSISKFHEKLSAVARVERMDSSRMMGLFIDIIIFFVTYSLIQLEVNRDVYNTVSVLNWSV
jgi:hypothetical protein